MSSLLSLATTKIQEHAGVPLSHERASACARAVLDLVAESEPRLPDTLSGVRNMLRAMEDDGEAQKGAVEGRDGSAGVVVTGNGSAPATSRANPSGGGF